MVIKILGTGCPNCIKLEKNTKQALAELKMEAQVEKVTEIQEIMSHGIMSTPALVIDGKVAVVGQVPNVEKIKQIIADAGANPAASQEKPASSCGCSCGGKC